MIRQNYILGCGITGKIFAFYNREYKIIGKNNSVTTSPIMNAFIVLHNNAYNLRFLYDLISISGKNINYTFKNMDVLCFDGETYKQEQSAEDTQNIINKKLQDLSGKKIDAESPIFVKPIALSENVNAVLKIIEVNFDEIHEALDSVINKQIVDVSNVKSIDLLQREIKTENNIFYYEDCVSTIPMNIFLKLCNQKVDNFEALDTTVVEGSEDFFNVPRIPSDDAVVYYPQKECAFTRINKRHGKCYAEYSGNVKINDNQEIMKNSKIVQRHIDFTTEHIMFLGRFAEWNPDIKFQDVIRKSSSKITMNSLWANQRVFSSKYYNFSPNIEIVQDNAEKLSALMQNEIFDLLNNTNWKKHIKNKIKFDADKIKEEWIDVFKYWLTLGINFGFTFEDFIDAYNKKSNKILEQEENKFNKQ